MDMIGIQIYSSISRLMKLCTLFLQNNKKDHCLHEFWINYPNLLLPPHKVVFLYFVMKFCTKMTIINVCIYIISKNFATRNAKDIKKCLFLHTNPQFYFEIGEVVCTFKSKKRLPTYICTCVKKSTLVWLCFFNKNM